MAKYLVNKKLWDQLSEEDHKVILETLQEAGSLSEGDSIEPSDDAPEILLPSIDFFGEQLGEERPEFGLFADNACQQACTSGYGVAVGRCNLLPLPQARAICFAAATAAYGACLAAC
jgi:hypothetical protein